MELELSPHLLSLTKKEYQSDFIDDRDRVIDELKKDYDKYKNIIDKLFEKGKHQITDLFKTYNIGTKGEIIFIPKSFVIYTSQGRFYKGLKCDVVIKNLKFGHMDEKQSKDLIKNIYTEKVFLKMLDRGTGIYVISDVFDKFKILIGMDDYGIIINDITLEYDE